MKTKMKLSLAASAALLLTGIVMHTPHADAGTPYAGSTFASVWAQVSSDPYASLPHYEVTTSSFFHFVDDRLLDASRRTLDDRDDLLPPFRKLLHPNGVCLAGTWNITEPTPYTGYYRQGSRALFVGRASTALTATEQGEFRAFGFAGKIFPTLDPNAQVETANFFTIEDLGGTLRPHYLDSENTNDILFVSPTPTALWNTGVGAVAAHAFATADQTLDLTQVFVRQLYPIAELGEADPSQAVAPHWMMITGAPDVPRVDAFDFRDEVRLAHYPSGLRFDIRTADAGTRIGPKLWRTIGFIEVTADALTASCDQRLHFSHPRFRR